MKCFMKNFLQPAAPRSLVPLHQSIDFNDRLDFFFFLVW